MIIYWLIKRWRWWRAARRAAKESTPAPPARRTTPAATRHTIDSQIDRDAAISVRRLRKAYDGSEAVRGIGFDVQRGEIVAFLGPNGAGKTTTVEILEGYRSRSDGEAQVLGEDPASAGASWRERVGIVLQESHPEPYLTARQCLELYAGYYRSPRPIDETLALGALPRRRAALSRASPAVSGVLAGGEIVAEGTPTTLGGRDRSAARITFTLPVHVSLDQLPPPFAPGGGGRRVQARR